MFLLQYQIRLINTAYISFHITYIETEKLFITYYYNSFTTFVSCFQETLKEDSKLQKERGWELDERQGENSELEKRLWTLSVGFYST